MSNIKNLIEITARLRDKDSGCPWDLEQTHQTLGKHTIEEVHELLHAIAINDTQNIKEELGDLLFQLVFYARIAEEDGQFNLDDVAGDICDKLVRRHPHIFAGKTYANIEEQQADWQRIKAEEKALKANQGKPAKSESLLDESYQSLPSIEQSIYFQKVAAKLGFDWQNANDVLPKISEEIDEVKAELNATTGEIDQAKLAEEYGDLLFACLNLGRKLNIDSDLALRQANHKFISRFKQMLELAGSKADFKALNLAEQENLWQAVKEKNKH